MLLEGSDDATAALAGDRLDGCVTLMWLPNSFDLQMKKPVALKRRAQQLQMVERKAEGTETSDRALP